MTTLLLESDQTQFLVEVPTDIDSNGSSFPTLENKMELLDIRLSTVDSQINEALKDEDNNLPISISDSSSSSISSCQKPNSADYSPLSPTEDDLLLDKPHSPIVKDNKNGAVLPKQTLARSQLEQKETNSSPSGYNNNSKQISVFQNKILSPEVQYKTQPGLLPPQSIPIKQLSPKNNQYSGPYLSNKSIYTGANAPLINATHYYNFPLNNQFYSGQSPTVIPTPAPGTYRLSGLADSPFLPPYKADGNYLADSSVAAANAAGRKSKKNTFPPPTRENLIRYRDEANTTNDPRLQLDYAKFLLAATFSAFSRVQDPRRVKKARENMTIEAQKIVKKLSSHSGMGKQGYPEAQFFLANCYGTGGLGLQKDPEKAFSLYLQGSKQNHPGCTYRAAVCYEVGSGTKRDKNYAMQFYRKAANLHEPTAMYKLSMILLKGFLGQPKNHREGISWLKRASQLSDEDHPQALHELAMAYEKEGVPSVIPDPNYSRELYSQAAQYGYAPSQFKLGLAYENGFLNCPIDPRRSIAWYSKAAEQGDLESQFALSGWYLTGADGVLQQNDLEAYLWARKAADRGYPKAQYAVGYYTETGTGTRQNLEEAKRWYRLAAAQNYRRARQRLAAIKKTNGRPQQKRRHTRDGNKHDSECAIM